MRTRASRVHGEAAYESVMGTVRDLWHRSCIHASCKTARLHRISHRVKMIRDGAGHFPSGMRGAGSLQE